MRRLRAIFTPMVVMDAVFVLVVIYVTIWSLHPSLLVSSTLLTGGDTGSHLALPAYLKTTGNVFNFTPWYPGWLAGLPAYTYYFILPDVLATLASYVIGFAVAFKLATVLGSVLMPVTAYAMGRLFRAPRPVPVALAIATLPFLFDATFTIDGGNLFSTMAGEYAFSLSLALALLTIGLFARGVRTGRGYWLAALSLSATLAAHVLPWLFSLGAIAILIVFELLHRRGIGEPITRDVRVKPSSRWATGVGLALLAFVPFFFDKFFPVNQSGSALLSAGAFSTRQGAFSLLLTLALALLTINRFMQGAPARRDYWLVVASGALTLASLFWAVRFSLAAVVALVAIEFLRPRGGARRATALGDYARPVRFAVGAGLLSFGLSAWWLLPFATTQSLSDSLGYQNVPNQSLRAIFTTLGWFNATGGAAGDRWIIVLAAVAIIAAFVVRDRLGMVLATISIASFWAFALDPQSAIWNQRLIPFWFISIHLVAGWLVGYLAWRWAARAPARQRWRDYFIEGDDLVREDAEVSSDELAVPELVEVTAVSPEDVDALEQRSTRRVVRASCAVVLLGLLSTLPGLIVPLANDLHLSTTGNQVTNWAQYNYSGYQAKPSWPEYHGLMVTMGRVADRYGCGRAMWEYNSSENRFGTPEALMLLPYWTDNCVDSMEGLLMESSATTPYHYLDQSELSAEPSDPQFGLEYGGVNVTEGITHLQLLGVKYYMAFTPSIVRAAKANPLLRLVATTRRWPAPGVKWSIFLVKDSPIVQAMRHTPNVLANVASQSKWLAANQTWWLTPSIRSVFAASSGPATWPRASSVNTMTASARLPKVTVTKVQLGLQSLSFHVSRVGVPMLVKISYYPRWHATGASGPYRVSPNLMAVVPTSHEVTLVYGSTPANTVGDALSDASVLAGLVTLAVLLIRRRNLRR